MIFVNSMSQAPDAATLEAADLLGLAIVGS